MMETRATGTPNGWTGTFLATLGVEVLALALILGGLNEPRLRAQSPVNPSPAIQAAQSLKEMEAAGVKMSFDVASVKPNNSGGPHSDNIGGFFRGAVYSPTGGLFSATSYTLVI